jgi:hypothetical protein
VNKEGGAIGPFLKPDGRKTKGEKQ